MYLMILNWLAQCISDLCFHRKCFLICLVFLVTLNANQSLTFTFEDKNIFKDHFTFEF